MNLRCSFCQTPFTIGRIEKLDALQHMDANNLSHYDAHCPRCRRATPIVRKRLEMTMPNWREALKELEAEMKANPQTEAPLPGSEPAPAAETESKPKPKPKAEKKAPAKKAPAKAKAASKTSKKKSK